MKDSERSEHKRLQSLAEKKKAYKQQKNVIQQALSNIETKQSNNKIIFDENDVTDDFEKNTFFLKPSKPKKKVELFEDNDEDLSTIDFNKQLPEDKGQKLLELQSRFAHDPRFKLDSRFIENEQDDTHNEEHLQETKNDLESEKKKQLDILASITGRKIQTHDPNKKQKSQSKGMLRFDPSKPDHTKFEIEKNDNSKTKEKTKKKQKINEGEKVEEDTVNVSKDTFYKVTDNLKESLQQKSSFSLLSMFGRVQDEEQNGEIEEATSTTSTKLKKTKHIGPVHNPFKYDSSDTEEDDDRQPTFEATKPVHGENGDYSDKGHKERFFFTSNDLRLKEGLEFILQTKNNINCTDYSNVRREVKQIVRAKVRNNKRKNRPFKNKLGGRKRIRHINKNS